MLAYTYLEKGTFRLTDKPKPVLREPGDALVRVTLSSICTSDLHIKHGSVPRAVPGITVGHEMVGVVESVGPGVQTVRPGDRVSVNVETFCGECFFCRHGYVNNCTDPSGGWALGCRIDGGQAEYVRVPYADQGLTKIPESVTDRQALFAGDILATGFWAARIAEIGPEDTVLILGAGPTGICTLLCVLLKAPKQVIVCEKDPARLRFVREHYPQVLTVGPEEVLAFTQAHSDHGGADRVLEVAGAEETFRLAWQCARPNAVVLGYPVITSGKFAHRGSFENLCGADEALLQTMSLENQVRPDVPPFFIWHTVEDQAVPVENSLLLAGALKENNVPFELHLFTHGGHGSSTCTNEVNTPNKHNNAWLPLCMGWLGETLDFTL